MKIGAWLKLMIPLAAIAVIVFGVRSCAGNITGDHMVIGVFGDLTYVLIPVIFMFLGLFVCFIQAFVFTMLSSVYIAMATSHDH